MPKYDVAIVDGGIAGLSAAIFAAQAGKRVIIFEKQEQLDGRTITQRKQGIYLNLGNHKGEAYTQFKKWGLLLAGNEPSFFDNFFLWKNHILRTPLHPTKFFQIPLLSWKGKFVSNKKTANNTGCFLLPGDDLLSQGPSPQVPSAH